MTDLYECDIPGCEWRNPDWRYGFADAGATWAYHMADHKDRPCERCVIVPTADGKCVCREACA